VLLPVERREKSKHFLILRNRTDLDFLDFSFRHSLKREDSGQIERRVNVQTLILSICRLVVMLTPDTV